MPVILRRDLLCRTAALAALLLLAACAGSPDPAGSTSADPGLVPTPAAVDLPAQSLDLGSVAAGRPAQVSASGSAVLTFDAEDDAVAVVAALDCTGCTGPVEVATPGHGTPWGRGTAPVQASYLVDLVGAEPVQQIVVEAEGEWTLRMSGIEDLPTSTGEQHGTGPVVLRLDEAGTHLRVAYTPGGDGDELNARMISLTDTDPNGAPVSVHFGADSAFDQSYQLTLPGVVALDTSGSWTVQPLP